MSQLDGVTNFAQVLHTAPASSVIFWLICLALCAPYIQGGLIKVLNFDLAMEEVQLIGLRPVKLIAILVIGLEFGAPIMILTGYYRWLGALLLAVFTATATFLVLRFWQTTDVTQRYPMMNAFFEHIALIGGLLLLAYIDFYWSMA